FILTPFVSPIFLYINTAIFEIYTLSLHDALPILFNSVNYEGRTDYNLFNIVIEETINKYKSNHDYYIDDDYDKIKEYYKSKLKRAFKFGDNNINGINRHSIMHGYDNKYGTKQNEIMLFLHFEYLYK